MLLLPKVNLSITFHCESTQWNETYFQSPLVIAFHLKYDLIKIQFFTEKLFVHCSDGAC